MVAGPGKPYQTPPRWTSATLSNNLLTVPRQRRKPARGICSEDEARGETRMVEAATLVETERLALGCSPPALRLPLPCSEGRCSTLLKCLSFLVCRLPHYLDLTHLTKHQGDPSIQSRDTSPPLSVRPLQHQDACHRPRSPGSLAAARLGALQAGLPAAARRRRGQPSDVSLQRRQHSLQQPHPHPHWQRIPHPGQSLPAAPATPASLTPPSWTSSTPPPTSKSRWRRAPTPPAPTSPTSSCPPSQRQARRPFASAASPCPARSSRPATTAPSSSPPTRTARGGSTTAPTSSSSARLWPRPTTPRTAPTARALRRRRGARRLATPMARRRALWRRGRPARHRRRRRRCGRGRRWGTGRAGSRLSLASACRCWRWELLGRTAAHGEPGKSSLR